MKLDYTLLDVFTTERLSGNPLAVVTKADGLHDDQMQRIAAEFNLSETVFIKRPQAERHTAAVRIFTPQVELPFAGHLPAVWSAGVVFYLVPVKSPGVLRRVKPDRRGWTDVFPLGHNSVYVYCETPDEDGNDYAARMFAPGMGLGEDPATGAAAAALIGQLAGNAPGGQTEYRLRQGLEMGRPSLITMQIRKDGDTLTHGGIGGSAVVVGQGSLDLYD